MSVLIGVVLLAMPLESMAYDDRLAFMTLPFRAGVLVVVFVLLQTDRIGPILAGRLFLGYGLLTMIGWSIVVPSPPDRVVVEGIAYGTILSIFALLIAPRRRRRMWSAIVIGVVLIPAGARLLPDDPTLFAQTVVVLVVHSVAMSILDIHTNNAERRSELASRDPLTGLVNRRPTMERLASSIDTAMLGTGTASVIVIDLDDFKAVNDTLGHEGGDLALVRVAEALTTEVRPTDLVSRWGGEEFLLVLSGLDETAAAAAAERLRCVVADTGVTASFGVAEVVRGDTATGWVRRADDAMYVAKQFGRDRVVCHSDVPLRSSARVS